MSPDAPLLWLCFLLLQVPSGAYDFSHHAKLEPRPGFGFHSQVRYAISGKSAHLNTIIRYKITHLTFVPSVVHQLVHHPKASKTDFSSIIAIGSGAAYLPPDLKDKLNALAPAQTTFVEGMSTVIP